ncbi:MAG: SDR family oxidoreductase [Acidiferrobacterales bacterium]
MDRVLIIGCGDIGARVAAHWLARGATVTALARSVLGADRLRALGIDPVLGDLDHPETLAHIDVVNRLLYYFAPPPKVGEIDLRMRALIDALSNRPKPWKAVYISTTGVYGDNHGAWVTEDMPANPQTARARRRLDAENVLRDWGKRRGVPVVILRVPGIYGPGRFPVETIRSGRPVVNEAECGFSNRIHAEDLALVCIAAAERGRADTIYNASDGNPGNMTDYFNRVADAFGLPRPPVVSRAEAARFLSPEMLSYIDESRRIDNHRIREELGIKFRYPSLQAGLDACADPGSRTSGKNGD